MSEFSLEIADASKAPCDFAQLRLSAMIGQRDEKAALRALRAQCRKLDFAEQAHYAVREVETDEETDDLQPSVEFMRAAASCYRHVSGGGQILRKFIQTYSVRGWAFDGVSGSYKVVDDVVDCVLKRRGKADVTLTGSHLRARLRAVMATAERRALQSVLPAKFISDGFAVVLATLERAEQRELAKDPAAALSWLRAQLEACDITEDEVQRKFGKPLADLDPEQRITLRAIVKSVNAGESDVLDHFPAPEWVPPSETPAAQPEPKPVPKPTPTKSPAPDVSGSDWRSK